MRFKLYTLIDITLTGARKGDDITQIRQQQNYLTAVQTIGIRANPEITKNPVRQLMNISKLGFGSDYKGNKEVWSLDFSFGANQTHTIEMLMLDFNLVPVIGDLSESITVEDWVFRTDDPKLCNIVFLAFND